MLVGCKEKGPKFKLLAFKDTTRTAVPFEIWTALHAHNVLKNKRK